MITDIAVVIAAAIGAGPAYLAYRRTGSEGSATREALSAVETRLDTRLDSVESWQIEHTLHHRATRDQGE